MIAANLTWEIQVQTMQLVEPVGYRFAIPAEGKVFWIVDLFVLFPFVIISSAVVSVFRLLIEIIGIILLKKI